MLRAPTTTTNENDRKKRGQILIVEDDVMIAAILQGRLKKMGYDAPITAVSGEEALTKVIEFQPAMVLMDIVLQGKMDGIEAAQCIRSQFDIPVIFLTSHTDKETLERASLTEPFGYIVKPFEEGELRAAIEIAYYRHRAEQQLRKMERWLTTTLRSIGDGVIATDTEGRVTMMNPVAEVITGWSQKEALGKPFEEVFQAINEDTRKPIESPVARSIKEGVVINLEEHTAIIARDGREVSIDDSAAPIRDEEDAIIGVVVVFRDSSERKRAEAAVKQVNEQLEERVKQRTAQLEAVNRELEAFTYSVSHDLRAPIRAIDGFANALDEDYATVLDDEGKRFLKVLRQNAQRMEKMVGDFLRLAQLGHSRLQFQNADMDEIVKVAVADLAMEVKKKHFKVNVGELPGAHCDCGLIRQVWDNLLLNAVKYSSVKSKPEIRISGEVKGGEVIYSVTDNGVGFDMRHADKLFGVFQRLHPASEFEGNGVGLAIVQRIVLRHEGRVWAQGAVDKGATFYFSLPHASK